MPKSSDFTHADFELNDKVINGVLKTLERLAYPTAAKWLDKQVRKSGLPIIVNNTSTTFHRIQKYWRTAAIHDPHIRECGNLVFRAFRNGDRSQVFYISDEEAYNPEAHAVAAERASSSPSPFGPLGRLMTFEDMLPTPLLPGWSAFSSSPALPPAPISSEPVIKHEETPVAPIVDVSYSATIRIAGDTQVIPFTAADKDDVIQSVEDYVEYCKKGSSIKYSTFAGVRSFMAHK